MGCEAGTSFAQSTSSDPAQVSGTPAQPLPPDQAGKVHTTTHIIAQQDTADAGDPACTIRFAYVGFTEESLIWDGEPCAALTATFFGQSDLERLGKWERLDDHARERVAASPDGKVLYVEGQFTASIYPIDINQLTYEVAVAD